MKGERRREGFTLAEVLCALALLFIILIPIYQSALNTARIQNKAEAQLYANQLAVSRMEYLKNTAEIAVGSENYTDTSNPGYPLYVESIVQDVTEKPDTAPGPADPTWNLRLVFSKEQILGIPLPRLDIWGRNGQRLGYVYGNILEWLFGDFLCELSSDYSLVFTGTSSLQISKAVLENQGVDLSKSGKQEGDLKLLCEGAIQDRIRLQINSTFPANLHPKHNVFAENRVTNLSINLWPGASRNVNLRLGVFPDDNTYVESREYMLTVKVYGQDTVNGGNEELIRLDSIRHVLNFNANHE